jgi:hypothetical protein
MVFLFLVAQLNSHFWLDENISYWTANGGLDDIVKRCTIWPHSVLYGYLVWAIKSMSATQPWAYRLPSLLGVAGASLVLFRLTKRIFDRETAWITLAVFISLEHVQFAADDASPYGLALFITVLSTDLLVRLLDRPSFALSIVYGVSAGLIPHFHMLFGAILGLHFLYFLAGVYLGKPLSWSCIGGAFITAALVAAPLVQQYRAAAANAKAHAFATQPELTDFLVTYFPEICLIGLFTAGIMVMLAGRPVKLTLWDIGNPANNLYRWLPLLWALVPVTVLFAFCRIASVQVFVPRYLLSFSPGFAMCLAILLNGLEIRLLKPIFLAALILLMLIALRHPTKLAHANTLGDWGEAIAFMDKQTAADHAPVLFRSMFVESDFMPLYPVYDNPVFAQLTFYPSTSQIIPLARTFQESQITQLDSFLAKTQTPSPRRFFLVFHGGLSSADSLVYYLKGRLGSEWQTQATEFDGANVMEFDPPVSK